VVLVPPAVVTVTSTVPAASAGAVIVREVSETTSSDVPAWVPKSTAVANVKPDPVTVTEVPPKIEPELGLTPVTTGSGATTVNWSAVLVALVPFGFVVVMSTVPAASDGETAVMDVSEFTRKDDAATVPNSTALAPLSPVPVIETDVPPAVVPALGLTAVIAGAGPGVT
jgi:hypothetical protein